jgi:GH15 family glucan-1,4-alpha-glucosidase
MQPPGRFGEFLIACARNILQAREVKNGKINFQVGPTVYRGLWVVDGNFILEAARYLGYDTEAQQGLEATWDQQKPSGAIWAGAGREHWKDTGIAIFTLVR